MVDLAATNTPVRDLLAKLNGRGVPWFSLRRIREVMRYQVVRDGRPETNHLSDSGGVFVEAFVDGAIGYACTSRDDVTSLQTALDRAIRNAQISSQAPVARFDIDAVRPVVKDEYRGVCQKPIDSLSLGEISDLLVQASQTAKIDPSIVKAMAFAGYGTRMTEIASTSGTDLTQFISLVTADVETVAEKDGVIQRRTMGGLRGLSRQGGAELLHRETLVSGARAVAEDALALVSAPECPSVRTTLVLAPDQMMLQIHESIGHPLELDRILGDERNYAGWSFVKPEDFGKRVYGSKLLNVTFDPTIPEEFATYGYDDIGNKATKEYLIKDGILMKGLGSLESQARLGIPGVANQRSSDWNRPPIDRMANLNIEPGNLSFDELIADIEDGIYMASNRSWSIDDYRNKFQFGCEWGQKIVNGKLAGVVRNPNYRGETQTFWHALTGLGAKETFGVFGTPYCGKGEPNQSIRVGHASPACRFDNIEVFGGAS